MAKTIVTSCGGCGTTLLIQSIIHAGIGVNSVRNRDGLKHLSEPLQQLPKDFDKVVYIYGNPMNACLSLYRRGYQDIHGKKLGRAAPRPIGTIRRDPFRLYYHFHAWMKMLVLNRYPVALVKVEAIKDAMPQLTEFVGGDFDYQFPVNRRCDWIQSPHRNRLEDIYGVRSAYSRRSHKSKTASSSAPVSS